jgi:hypothetical protein
MMEGPSRSWWILTGAVILVGIIAGLSKGTYWPLVLLPIAAYSRCEVSALSEVGAGGSCWPQ